MTTSFYLIRHAAHAHLGQILSGRLPGIPLSQAGADQARALAAGMAPLRFAAIHTSPIDRAAQTAAALAVGRRVPIVEVEALNEVDFGCWTGQRFSDLQEDPRWSAWNCERGTARAADGETMKEAQARFVDHLEATSVRFPGAAVAVVSHCDLIRAAVAHYLGLPLDHLLRFDVDPASVSRVVVGDWGGRVQSINEAMT